jgi:transposase
MNNIKRIAIDLAKNVFQVCAMNEKNKVLYNKKLSRNELFTLLSILPPVQVFMEACYSAHFWGRTCNDYGHSAFLIPAQHVKPFVRGNKNDANDALAIMEASSRPFIRFVPVKTTAQQEIMAMHRLRERWIKNRTSITNQARGLLSDFGVIFPKGFKGFREAVLQCQDNEIFTLNFRKLLLSMLEEFNQLSERIEQINEQLKQYTNENQNCKIVSSLPGIGFINSSAIVAQIDKGQAFDSPKKFSVWLGITPSQYASGEKSRDGSITKRGNRYLRKQLIHGARAAMRWARNRDDKLSRWINQIIQRIGVNKAAVAIANKLARLIWVLLQKQETFKAQAI